MCVCASIDIDILIYVYNYTFLYIHICIYIYICTYDIHILQLSTWLYRIVHLLSGFTHIIYKCIHIFVFIYTYIYIYTYIHTYMYMYIWYTHIAIKYLIIQNSTSTVMFWFQSCTSSKNIKHHHIIASTCRCQLFMPFLFAHRIWRQRYGDSFLPYHHLHGLSRSFFRSPLLTFSLSLCLSPSLSLCVPFSLSTVSLSLYLSLSLSRMRTQPRGWQE